MCFKMLKENYFEVKTNELAFVGELKSLEENTKWLRMPISDLRISDIDNTKILYNGISNMAYPNYSTNDKEFIIYQNSMQTVLDRARINGSALSDLLPDIFANVVNSCLEVGKGDTILNVVDDYLCAAHSDGYIILDIKQLFSKAIAYVHNTFPTAVFIGGGVSIDFAYADFNLSGVKVVSDAYKKALGDTADKFDIIMRFTSSNTGKSGANIYPFMMRKYGNVEIKYQIGKPIALEHKGDCSFSKYEENLRMSQAMLIDSADTFAKLRNIDIQNPTACFLNVAKRVGLPKKYAVNSVNDYESFLNGSFVSNAQDMYLALTEILNYAYKDGRSEAYIIMLQDLLSRALTVDFSEYDVVSCDWKNSFVTPMTQQTITAA